MSIPIVEQTVYQTTGTNRLLTPDDYFRAVMNLRQKTGTDFNTAAYYLEPYYQRAALERTGQRVLHSAQEGAATTSNWVGDQFRNFGNWIRRA